MAFPATLTPGATTGQDVIFTADEPVFLTADVGRMIVFGASRAVIRALGPSAGDTGSPNAAVRADILDDFPDTLAIPARSWFLRLSPQTTLDANKKGPVGTQVTLVAGADAFRNSDRGKFIVIFGGLVRIDFVDSVTQVRGEILSELSTTEDDPPAAVAGSWTLEVASWSDTNGWPRTGEFYQGRLAQASTRAQPTTFWLSASDSFDDYAVGVKANDAIDYTIASRKINRIEWLSDHISLFVGTSGAEFSVEGTNQSNPLGGDAIPIVTKLTQEGSAPVQPAVIGKRLLFLDRSRRKLFMMIFDFYENGYNAEELTAVSEHILGTAGIRLGQMAIARRPDPRLFLIRSDGQMVVLTFLPLEKIIGFSRFVTDGRYESVAVIPQASGAQDQVWVTVVRERVNHDEDDKLEPRRYVERFDENAVEMDRRPWSTLYCDSAVTSAPNIPMASLAGLDHLEGRTVNIVGDGSFRGTKVVEGGEVTFDEEYGQVEIGLDYVSTLETMRPAITGAVIEGQVRNWTTIFARLLNTVGGYINGELIEYPASPLNQKGLFTGDRLVLSPGWDKAGRLLVTQPQPYPMTLLGLFGALEVGGEGDNAGI